MNTEINTFHADLSTITFEYAITDGEDFVVWAANTYFGAVFATHEAATERMSSLCWHPKRYAGAFRVERVQVERSKWGSVMEVRREA